MSLDWIVTVAALAGGLVLLLFSIWQSSRPKRDSIRPRWVPWQFLVLAAAAVIFLGAIHLVTLIGLRPGA